MRYLLFLLFISGILPEARAQYIGLNNSEIIKLKEIISKDKTAQTYYASFKNIADRALAEKPDPVDTIVSEGHLATDPKKILSGRSLLDVEKIYSLAIAYRIENNSSYVNKLIEFLISWATVNQPQGNPINDTKLENIFVAYDLIKKDLSIDKKKIIDDWFVKIGKEEIRTGKNKTKTTSFNNWNSHRLKVIGCIAFVLDNDEFKRYINESFPEQIEKNLLPDGSGFDFLERDALHYHVYTLEPLITLATVLKRATGKDYYNYLSPSGASINKSVAFLIPYVTGEKTHGEYVNSKVAFDKKRSENKEPGFEIGANFNPARAIPVIISAAYFQPSLMTIVKKVTNNKSLYPDWQAVLNSVK